MKQQKIIYKKIDPQNSQHKKTSRAWNKKLINKTQDQSNLNTKINVSPLRLVFIVLMVRIAWALSSIYSFRYYNFNIIYFVNILKKTTHQPRLWNKHIQYNKPKTTDE